jgi:hypothetical protein
LKLYLIIIVVILYFIGRENWSQPIDFSCKKANTATDCLPEGLLFQLLKLVHFKKCAFPCRHRIFRANGFNQKSPCARTENYRYKTP